MFIIKKIKSKKDPNSRQLAALKCYQECNSFTDDLSDHAKLIMSYYIHLQRQVLVAGLGSIIGLNHLAIHQFLEMEGFIKGELDYKYNFYAINEIFEIEQELRMKYDKNNKDKGSSSIDTPTIENKSPQPQPQPQKSLFKDKDK